MALFRAQSSPSEDLQIQEMQSRIELLELNGRFTATQDDISNEQLNMLQTLREIRAALLSSPTQSSSKDFSKLSEENEKLKKTNTKQRYRIDHLLMTIYDLQEKLKMSEEKNKWLVIYRRLHITLNGIVHGLS